MQIETYEVEEHTTEGRDPFEVDAEAEALIESLGLDGQRSLLVESDDPDVQTKTRVPYRRMTAEEERVYDTLYPEHAKVEAYNVAPIPLRVLQVISHARPLFKRVEVWGPKTQDPDPVLVGVVDETTPHGFTREVRYILARWGETLVPFEELLEKAVRRLATRWKANAEKVAAECMAFMDAPEHDVREYLSGEFVHRPWT